MKIVVAVFSLATLATALPPILRENINDVNQKVINFSESNIREKKSPLHISSQDLSFDHGLEDTLTPNGKLTELQASSLEKRTPSIRKPIIVKKKFGYHVYRDSDEEMAHADPHEKCNKQVKVKLCDSEPVLHTNLNNINLEHLDGVALGKEMEHSINMAKEAVENLQRDLWKMEQNSEKLSNSKEELKSDTELKQDIENARKVLEHIQHSIGNFESIDFQSNIPKIEETQTLNPNDVERLNQWKQAIENIHKNFEIAKNIEDAFKIESVALASDHKEIEKTKETGLTVAQNIKQKSNPELELVGNAPLMMLNDEEHKSDLEHSSQLKMSDKKDEHYEETDEMFVAPTNHEESKMNLHSENLISENILKETMLENHENAEKDTHKNNHLKSAENLPHIFENEAGSTDDKQKPIRATSDFEMTAHRHSLDNSNFDSPLTNNVLNMDKPNQSDKHERDASTPLRIADIMSGNGLGTETESLSQKPLLIETMTPKKTFTDEEQEMNGQFVREVLDEDKTDKNELQNEEEGKQMDAKFGIIEDISNKDNPEIIMSELSKNKNDVTDEAKLKEAFPMNLLQIEEEELQQKPSNTETALDENHNNARLIERMNEKENMNNLLNENHGVNDFILKDLNKAIKSASEIHSDLRDQTKYVMLSNMQHKAVDEEKQNKNDFFRDPLSLRLAQEKLQEEIKTIVDSHNAQQTLSQIPLNELKVKSNEEKHSSLGKNTNNMLLHENAESHEMHNLISTSLVSKPQTSHHHLFDHSSDFLRNVQETENLNRPLLGGWAQGMPIRDHVSQVFKAEPEFNQGNLMSTQMKTSDLHNQNPAIREQMIMRMTEDQGLGQQMLHQQESILDLQSKNRMMVPMKSFGLHPALREQMNMQMTQDQNINSQLADSHEIPNALIMSRAQETVHNDHTPHMHDTAVDFHTEDHHHLHELPRFNNFESDSRDFSPMRSRMHDHIHVLKHAKSSDMDNAMQPSMHFGIRDSEMQWGPRSQGITKSSYSPSLPVSGPSAGAVGVFPNANTACGIPLLLSCSPSVVTGSLAKTHSTSITAPAYRSGDDFMYYMKRNVDGLSNIKIQKSSIPHTPKTELHYQKA